MPKSEERRRRAVASRAEADRKERASALVDEASDDSFPASDAPPYTVCGVGVPSRTDEAEEAPTSR